MLGLAGKIELEPDSRVQNAVHLVLRKFQELGSARQVLPWCHARQITLPSVSYSESTYHIYWKPPRYGTILAILQNPMYAGAYAFGRTEARTKVVAGRPRQTAGRQKPREQWTVLIPDHHPAYISWEDREVHQLAERLACCEADFFHRRARIFVQRQ